MRVVIGVLLVAGILGFFVESLPVGTLQGPSNHLALDISSNDNVGMDLGVREDAAPQILYFKLKPKYKRAIDGNKLLICHFKICRIYLSAKTANSKS